MGFFTDGPEYIERAQKDFVPSNITIKQVNDIVPKECFERSTPKALWYWGRDIGQSIVLWWMASKIEDVAVPFVKSQGWGSEVQFGVKWGLWSLYWVMQSISFAGMWLLGMYFSFYLGLSWADQTLDRPRSELLLSW